MVTVHVACPTDSEQRKREVKDQPAEATAGEAAALAGEAPPHAPQACLCADWQCSSLHVLPAAATVPAAPVPGYSCSPRSLSSLKKPLSPPELGMTHLSYYMTGSIHKHYS